MAADERILGGGDFVQGILSEAQERAKETLRLSLGAPDLRTLAKKVSEIQGVNKASLRSASGPKRVVRARKTLCQLAVWKMGYPRAEVARFIGVPARPGTTSAVNPAAASEESVVHDGSLSIVSETSVPLQNRVWFPCNGSGRIRINDGCEDGLACNQAA